MPAIFKLISTPAFEKEVKFLTRRDAGLNKQLAGILDSLKEDPYNITKKSDIKKLAGIDKGEGQ